MCGAFVLSFTLVTSDFSTNLMFSPIAKKSPRNIIIILASLPCHVNLVTLANDGSLDSRGVIGISTQDLSWKKCTAIVLMFRFCQPHNRPFSHFPSSFEKRSFR